MPNALSAAAIGLAAIVDRGEVGLLEDHPAALRRQLLGDRLAAFGVAPDDDDAGGTALNEQSRRRFAKALRAAGHHRVFALKRPQVRHANSSLMVRFVQPPTFTQVPLRADSSIAATIR